MRQQKRVILAAGGSGGHLYPAMATAEALKEHAEVLFVAAGLAKSKFFDRERYAYVDVPSGGGLRTLVPLTKGVCKAIKILKEFRPDVVVGFGSYHSLPPLIAAKMLGVPIVLHEANSVPGKVVRWLSPFSKLTGVQFPGAAKWMSGCVEEVPLPLRAGYQKGALEREEAAVYYGLDPSAPTILVFGGSQGAQAINRAVDDQFATAIKQNIPKAQFLHFCGTDAEVERLKNVYEHAGLFAVVKSHEPSMNYAWSCSDLAVSRAGASTIAEQLAFEIPALYIPFPEAADNHQYLNALFVANDVKGGELLLQKDLYSTLLAQKILAILSKDGHNVNMVQHIQRYKQAHSKLTLSEWILKI
jgi:UDP-N-acetylglucosamine--N-acetylmuramyl-(pentapeptide) pyrophosphoryl-undecaprenol N-acetylglucosamine transferase